MLKAIVSVAILCASLTAQSIEPAGSSAGNNLSQAAATQTTDPVILWNRTLLTILRTPGAQPATVHPTRSFAIMHAAIYDAVNGIDRTHRPFLVRVADRSRRASMDAAASAAAHEVLVSLYPSFQATLDAQFQQMLGQIPDDDRRSDGVEIGNRVADSVLALRGNDGSNIQPPPFVFKTAPGDFQSTPPNFPKQPQFSIWSHVTPFVLESASQFRPGRPPALTSARYSQDFNEVKSLGIQNGSTRTPDQTEIGRFWSGPIQNYWNEITQTAAIAHHLTTAQSARLFALLDLTLADSVIAFYDAKYTYQLWRPVTAVRAADADDNPLTAADPNWLPLTGNTPPDPSYPGAHAVISRAGAFVLSSFFGQDHFDFTVTSEVLPGVLRSFSGFSAAAEQASASRIFAGNHFRFDEDTGQRMGREVADFVVDNVLTPRRGERRSREDEDDER